MSSIKLDLSQFKHIKSDGASTTLQHKKGGHILTVLHDALSSDNQSQLKALGQLSKDSETSTQAQEAKAKYAKGGKVAKYCMYCGGSAHEGECKESYADGGGVLDTVKNVIKKTSDFYTEPDPDGPKPNMGTPKTAQELVEDKKPSKPQSDKPKFAAGGDIPEMLRQAPQDEDPLTKATAVPTDLPKYTPEQIQADKAARLKAEEDSIKNPYVVSQDPDTIEKQSLQNLRIESEDKKAAEQAAAKETAQKKIEADALAKEKADYLGVNTPVAQQQATQVTPETSPQPEQDLVAQQMQQQPQGPSHDPGQMMSGGYDQQIQGIQQEANAMGQLGSEQSKLLNKNLEVQQAAQNKYNEQFSQLNAERQAAIQDVRDGHIDPNQYWTGDPKTGEGSHSKIAAGIGMILAGFNPTDRPNAAIEFLQHQMDKNLEAQVRNLSSKETLLSHNMQQFHNLKDATEMTRIMQNDMLAHQLESAAAQAKTPLAQAAAKQAAGKLMQDNAGRFMMFSAQRAMMGLSGENNPEAVGHLIRQMAVVDPERAKHYQEAFVPGVGLSKTLMPISPEVRRQLTAHEQLDAAARTLQDFIKKNGGAIDRLTPDKRAQAAALVLPVQAAFREGTLGTVYREGEQPLLDKAVKGQPLDLASYFVNTEPTKLKTLLNSNRQQSNVLKKQYDLPVQQQQEAPEIKVMNGVQYQKVQGGWQRVK